MALDHVGGGAAHVAVSVVDAGGIDHVLPQVVAAHVHQLHGVQGAAAQVGLSAGMGGDAVKGEVGTHNGHTAPGTDLVDGFRVPGVGEVHVVEISGPGDELLGTGPLLGRTAEEDHSAVLLFLHQIVLQGHGGGIAPRTQQVVAAAVTGTALLDGLLDRAACLLAQAGQGVVLRQKAHHRLAAAGGKGGGKGGGNIRDALLNGEALLFQSGDEGGGGLGFLVGKLGVAPDLLGQGYGGVRLGGDQVFNGLDHCINLLYSTMLRNLMVLGS